MALLAAKPEFRVLLGSLGVGRAATLEGVGTGALARFVEFIVDGDIEEIGFVGAEIVAVFAALWL